MNLIRWTWKERGSYKPQWNEKCINGYSYPHRPWEKRPRYQSKCLSLLLSHLSDCRQPRTSQCPLVDRSKPTAMITQSNFKELPLLPCETSNSLSADYCWTIKQGYATNTEQKLNTTWHAHSIFPQTMHIQPGYLSKLLVPIQEKKIPYELLHCPLVLKRAIVPRTKTSTLRPCFSLILKIPK